MFLPVACNACVHNDMKQPDEGAHYSKLLSKPWQIDWTGRHDFKMEEGAVFTIGNWLACENCWC